MEALDFQKATSERIIELFDQGQTRVLLADEVGLGKTIIAREVVLAIAQKYRDQGKKFKVVYVCSNINIAAQNCRKLGIKISGNISQRISRSRLSMQLLCLREDVFENEQLIPLTPATSFTMKGKSTGIVSERALIYCMLSKHPSFSQYKDRIYKLLDAGSVQSWYYDVQLMQQRIDDVIKKDKTFLRDFRTAFTDYLKEEKTFAKLLRAACKSDFIPNDQRIYIIKNLRMIFAKISLKTLNPDLVIMDEFQRFKELVDTEGEITEQKILSREFLKDSSIKVLLLSATPYKPYSTLEELCSGNDGNHYDEFKKVMRFLNSDVEKQQEFEERWDNYSNHFYEIKSDSFTELLELKNEAEQSLYQVICRTERRNDNIIDTSKAVPLKENLTGDIKTFIDFQTVMDQFELGKFPVEYAKSAPYLMSFMNYQVKDKILNAVTSNRKKNLFTDTMYLKKRDIDSYKQFPINNARLSNLYKEVFGEQSKGAEYLLWIPASMPYYDAKNTKTGKVYSDNYGYTKTLVFSSWEMVPRVIAGLTSYEAERLVMKKLPAGQRLRYFADDSSDSRSSKRKGVHQMITSDNVELYRYPCETLAELYDPIAYFGKTIGNVRYGIKKKIAKLLTRIKKQHYYTTVKKSATNIYNFLLDLDSSRDDSTIRFRIPNGIEDILVDITIGSPAVCAYRIFNDSWYAYKIADHFVDLFNKPETVAIMRALYGAKGKYYEHVFKYCCEGNLQAVLDEYAFVLNEKGATLYDLMDDGFVTTARLKFVSEEFIKKKTKKASSLRTHFAVGYYNAKISIDAIQRTENIRNAFNSPFRPFVLATTSIGQEGLDFHLYSRRIMHWNLPSNPIDIEQREGRVNRFMCHAIRQNLAENLSLRQGFIKGIPVWETIINNAKILKSDNSDLVPYWCLPKDYVPTKCIERIVPMYPYSADIAKYERLINILAMYRLTLGQPRQEELLDTIQNANVAQDKLEDLYMNLSPWERDN